MQDSLALRLDYVGQNKDWLEFANAVSKNTGNLYRKLWIDNAKTNRLLVHKYGWAAEALQDTCKGKTAVLLGASPAIKDQIDKLKSLQYDERFVLIGVTSGLRYLLENGITPKFCMICDADPTMIRFWDGLDMELTKDITLISSISVHHDMLKKWKGDIKFLAIMSDDKEVERKINKWYRPLNGIGYGFFALSSQYNTGTAAAYTILGTHVIIFVGNELSFKDSDTPYYCDRRDIKDQWERRPHIDIWGNKVYTTYSFMALKLSLEDFLGKVPGTFINATEAGIFGVSNRYGNLPWINVMRLDMAIKQAEHLMTYGEPIYEPEFVRKPSLIETVQYGGLR